MIHSLENDTEILALMHDSIRRENEDGSGEHMQRRIPGKQPSLIQSRWQINFVRRTKLRSGLRKAARKRGMFHVWFHSYDVAFDPDRMLNPLEATFQEVNRPRGKGVLEKLTMAETAEMLAVQSPAGVSS